MKKSHIWAVLFLPFIILFGASNAFGIPQAEYIGSEMCLECHDTMLDTLKKTQHINVIQTKNADTIESCEACHGPGSVHMDDPEVTGSIRSFKQETAAETAAACLTCHKEDSRFKHFQSEKHFLSGEACTSCHTIHQVKPTDRLINDEAEKMCFSCHQEKEAAFTLPFHHKVKEGRMTCWNCHDPHNTETSNQSIGKKKIYDRCFTCHPSQQGPFTYEHIGVNAGGCSVCHSVHGSENARLLQRANQYLLCIECHSGPSLSSRLLGTQPSSFHMTNKATYQNCTVCHVKIHGSYLERYFLR